MPEFTWTGSLGFTWVHLGSHSLIYVHLGWSWLIWRITRHVQIKHKNSLVPGRKHQNCRHLLKNPKIPKNNMGFNNHEQRSTPLYLDVGNPFSCIYLNLPKCTKMYLNLPEFTWVYLNLPEFTLIYLNLPKRIRISVQLPEFTWIYLILLEFTWICLNLSEFTRIYLNLPRFAWIYLNGFSWVHLGSFWFTKFDLCWSVLILVDLDSYWRLWMHTNFSTFPPIYRDPIGSNNWV